MRPYRTLSLALISLMVVTFTGCRQARFLPAGMVELPRISLPVSPENEKISYKTRLNTSRGEFSGMMVIKKMAEEEYRIAFFSELGMSYFEASLGPGTFPWHLEFKSMSPFLATSNTAMALEVCLDLLLVPGKVLNSSEPMKDQYGSPWLKAAFENEISYFGKIDEAGNIVHSFFSKDGMHPRLEMELDYSTESKGYPSSVILKDKKGQMVLGMEAI